MIASSRVSFDLMEIWLAYRAYITLKLHLSFSLTYQERCKHFSHWVLSATGKKDIKARNGNHCIEWCFLIVSIMIHCVRSRSRALNSSYNETLALLTTSRSERWALAGLLLLVPGRRHLHLFGRWTHCLWAAAASHPFALYCDIHRLYTSLLRY